MAQSGVTIDVQQLCCWLGLPPNCWPPDHYTLLGLPPGEPNLERIEHRVHQRLASVRSYQISNPTLATEAMTRLAKAFDCLTDPERKKCYDAAHCPQIKGAVTPVSSYRVPTVLATTDTAETPALEKKPSPGSTSSASAVEPLQWQSSAAAPPVRAAQDTSAQPPTLMVGAQPIPPDQPTPLPAPLLLPSMASPFVGMPVPNLGPMTACLPLGPGSDSGRYRPIYLVPSVLPQLGTRRDLYDRVLWTRQFSRAWNRLGKYLRKSRRRLTKPTEAADLTRLLRIIDELAVETPELIGQPGQPGYRVFALNAQEPVAERFMVLDDDQRVSLALDWSAGRKLLTEFRQHLMGLVKGRRRLSHWQRFRTGVDSLLAAHGGMVVLVLGLVAVLILAIVYVR